MKIIDLSKVSYRSEIIEKFEAFKSEKIQGFKEAHSTLPFKVGDTINFWGGYYGDIRYQTTILGFDKDDDCYLLWETYWFPIDLNDKKREVELVKI